MKIQAKAGKCYVCGGILKHSVDQQNVKCVKCGKQEKTNILCEDGHYLCEKCAVMNTVEDMSEKMLGYTEKDPMAVAEAMIKDCGIFGNSPHSLVTAAFLVAYRNMTNKIDDEKIKVGFERAIKIPGGWCGFNGTCGAAVGIGTAFAVIQDSTPMSDRERSISNRVTALALNKIADLGGPRCCISSVRAAIEAGCEMLGELDASFAKSECWDKDCGYPNENSDCRKEKCPYYKR